MWHISQWSMFFKLMAETMSRRLPVPVYATTSPGPWPAPLHWILGMVLWGVDNCSPINEETESRRGNIMYSLSKGKFNLQRRKLTFSTSPYRRYLPVFIINSIWDPEQILKWSNPVIFKWPKVPSLKDAQEGLLGDFRVIWRINRAVFKFYFTHWASREDFSEKF